MHRTLGRVGEAREDYGRAIAIREELVKANPKFTNYVVSLASSVRRLGLLRLATGDDRRRGRRGPEGRGLVQRAAVPLGGGVRTSWPVATPRWSPPPGGSDPRSRQSTERPKPTRG